MDIEQIRTQLAEALKPETTSEDAVRKIALALLHTAEGINELHGIFATLIAAGNFKVPGTARSE